MKKNFWLPLVMVMILPVVVLTMSCAKDTVQSQPATAPQPEDRAEALPGDAEQDIQSQDARQPSEEEIREAAARKAFINDIVYFDFDSAALSEQSQQILNQKAEYLRAYPDVAVTIEGHADARGTDGYNMALGQRRADSVKQYLVYVGIDQNRLDTISYGEERPLEMGENEESWAKNRRAEFAID